MPALAPRLWTAAELQALPDDPTQRRECVDGRLLVSPTPRTVHQSAVTVLAVQLEALLRPAGAGATFVAPSEWVLDPGTLVQPDLYVVPLTDGRRPLPTRSAATRCSSSKSFPPAPRATTGW
ncbi:MAG: Uma2 family endonuclease [Gemmatimonadota bacterium]